MKIEIKNRWTEAVIFECEADSLKLAVELAVSKRISLRSANLRDADLRSANLRSANLRSANLSYADLSEANLRSADLSDADLRSANLRSANLRSANLSEADLSYADLSEADLSYADLSYADLRSADLLYANLRFANLRDADLRDAKTDLHSVLDLVPNEVPGLYMALLDGKVDGSTYSGACACLVGTIANVRGVNYEKLGDLRPDSERPSERWFMGIRKGDTPDNSPVSAVTADWIREYCKEKNIALPERKVIWE